MSSHRRNTKRDTKKTKKDLQTKEEIKEDEHVIDDIANEDKSEDIDGLMEHSSRMGSNEAPTQGFLAFDCGEDGNSTIYHVPSFLLKTYEIVDVRIVHVEFRIGQEV